MKTTLDLPEDLVTEIKLKAARERRKMKDIAAEALRAGLLAGDVGKAAEKEILLQRRLAALDRIEKPGKEEHEALMKYLVEYREDRETSFDHSE
jgi:plasmid stability protein